MQHEMKRLLEFRKKVEVETDPTKKMAMIEEHEAATTAFEGAKAPGTKDELQDVWEKDDGFDRKSFDPKTFFSMHDINGDKVLDTREMEAMFLKEATRMHQRRQKRKGKGKGNGAPDGDVDELVVKEESARMREHVMKNADKDGDGMVSIEEWSAMTNKKSFEKKEKWDPINAEAEVTEKQLEQFKKLQDKIKATKHGELDPKLLKAARRFQENIQGKKGKEVREQRRKRRRDGKGKGGKFRHPMDGLPGNLPGLGRRGKGRGKGGKPFPGSGMGKLTEERKKKMKEVAKKIAAAKKKKDEATE